MDDLEHQAGVRAGVAANLTQMYAADQRGFLETMAAMLESALPGQVRIERQGGLFGEKRIRVLDVHLGEHNYTMESLAAGIMVSTRSKIVRGTKLRTETLPVDQWLDALTADLEEHAQSNQQARNALQRFVGE